MAVPRLRSCAVIERAKRPSRYGSTDGKREEARHTVDQSGDSTCVSTCFCGADVVSRGHPRRPSPVLCNTEGRRAVLGEAGGRCWALGVARGCGRAAVVSVLLWLFWKPAPPARVWHSEPRPARVRHFARPHRLFRIALPSWLSQFVTQESRSTGPSHACGAPRPSGILGRTETRKLPQQLSPFCFFFLCVTPVHGRVRWTQRTEFVLCTLTGRQCKPEPRNPEACRSSSIDRSALHARFSTIVPH